MLDKTNQTAHSKNSLVIGSSNLTDIYVAIKSVLQIN